MPWWAWLLVDLFVVLGSLGVLVWAGWSLFRRSKAFLRTVTRLLADLPQVQRPSR